MRTFNVRLFYLYKFMSECLPIYAFYTILFIEKGMSVTDVAVLMALWSIFTIIFEVPSGVLADRWNRRNMLVIAAVLKGLCFMIWYFSHTFLMFTIGFVFWAVSGAVTSGTEEGLIYDNLKSDGCEKSFSEVYGKARFYTNAGLAVGIVSAGIIATFTSIEMIALISAAICFMNVILTLQMREKNYYAERLEEKPVGFFGTFTEAVAFIKGSRTIQLTIVFLVLFANLGDYLEEFDAIIIHDFQIDHIWVSVILAIRYVFTALGNVLAPHVQKKISSVRQIFVLEGMACMFLAVFVVIWNQYALLAFGLGLMILAITEILLVNTLQRRITEEGRATVMSFYGIGQNIVMICFSLVYALLAGIFALQQVYVIVVAYAIAGGASFYSIFYFIKGRT